ncbi:MAG: type III secretion system chaperone [Cyanobacteria bacterium P01_G01_bin.54]
MKADLANPNKIIKDFFEESSLFHSNFIVDYRFDQKNNRWISIIQYGSRKEEVFYAEILTLKKWISITSNVMYSLDGHNLCIFNESMARLSSQLNGVSLSMDTEGKFICVQCDLPHEGLNAKSLFQVIERFYDFYNTWYGNLIIKANELGLKFRKGRAESVDKIMSSYGLLPPPIDPSDPPKQRFIQQSISNT